MVGFNSFNNREVVYQLAVRDAGVRGIYHCTESR